MCRGSTSGTCWHCRQLTSNMRTILGRHRAVLWPPHATTIRYIFSRLPPVWMPYRKPSAHGFFIMRMVLHLEFHSHSCIALTVEDFLAAAVRSSSIWSLPESAHHERRRGTEWSTVRYRPHLNNKAILIRTNQEGPALSRWPNIRSMGVHSFGLCWSDQGMCLSSCLPIHFDGYYTGSLLLLG